MEKDASWWKEYRARKKEVQQIAVAGQSVEVEAQAAIEQKTSNWIERDGKRMLWSERRGRYIELEEASHIPKLPLPVPFRVNYCGTP